MTTFSAATLLFLVMDPFGNIPLFVTALQHVEARRTRWVVSREMLVALGVLVGCLFAGQYLLSLLQISEAALAAAGGTVLFLIALKMIFPGGKWATDEEIAGEPFIVPLAVPYVAGPSAISTVLLIMNRDPGRWPEWLIAVLAAWLVSGVVLLASVPLARLLGRKVLAALQRLMGLLLAAIAIQMLMTGLKDFLASP